MEEQTTTDLKAAPKARARRRAQVNRLRVEYVLALRGVLDSFVTANGTPAALQAAHVVRVALNAALLPDELAKQEELQ